MGFHNDRFCLGQLLVAPRINDASNKERDVVLVIVDVEQERLVHVKLAPEEFVEIVLFTSREKFIGNLSFLQNIRARYKASTFLHK